MSIFWFLLFLIPLGGCAQQCQDIPALNLKIVQLAEQKIQRRVGRGECWDLAQYVLNTTGAKWDQLNEYGRKINPRKECIFPGDIIQFERIKIKYQEKGMTFKETMPHHTAIVSRVKNKNEIYILHQNTAEFGKTVGESRLRFDTITSGEMLIYRPVK